ncbi:hypothetical protein [Prosthecochloris vibrioformis]|uniref:Uncharacterized protein n=1 Tax=Prosthecochloris vibrioformis TaxID=1098 RepID=A0A5C4RS84_PROVB|nr:hypothetical protein [Prosthecochloris vibrioformis]TNJ34020.1 hypothetical protein FGF68_10755 [Prosthecochloris vibrioformis]
MPIKPLDEIKKLKEILAEKEDELARVAKECGAGVEVFTALTQDIHALDIDAQLKREMTDTSVQQVELRRLEVHLGIELTNRDYEFIQNLRAKHPNLNPRELMLAVLIRQSYPTLGIAPWIGISSRGLESIRYRMHKKMGQGEHQSIKNYLAEM